MKNKNPIVDRLKLHKIGSAYAIFVPVKWFRANSLDPDEISESEGLLIVGDLDIRIVNPLNEEEVYDEVTAIARKVRTNVLGEF